MIADGIKSGGAFNLIQAIEASLLAVVRFNFGVETKPVAVLWTDADGQWEPLIKKLQERLPQLWSQLQHLHA